MTEIVQHMRAGVRMLVARGVDPAKVQQQDCKLGRANRRLEVALRSIGPKQAKALVPAINASIGALFFGSTIACQADRLQAAQMIDSLPSPGRERVDAAVLAVEVAMHRCLKSFSRRERTRARVPAKNRRQGLQDAIAARLDESGQRINGDVTCARSGAICGGANQ